MRNLLLLLGFFIAACSMSGSGLGSLAVEGHEFHASLRTPPLDSFRDLPSGVVPPKNPQLSTDDKFVQGIARNSSMGLLGPEGIRSALYARYAAGEGDMGVYGLELKTKGDADWREKALREINAHNGRIGMTRVHRKGLVLVVVWQNGLSAECWEAVNASIVKRLSTP
jgi:hypothetical protein